MSSYNNSAASIKSAAKKDLLWKLGNGPFVIEMYQVFLNYNGEINLSYLSKEHLNRLLKYSINKKLTEEIYIELRGRVFSHKSRDSIIVNEIKGIYELLRNCKDYLKITLEMRRNINDK